MRTSASLPLPRAWAKVVHRGVLQAISIAATAMTHAWSRTSSSRFRRARERAEIDRLHTEGAPLTEELALKDVRWARVPARRRPHYGPLQRMRILELRAARGWSTMQTAARFLVIEETIAYWMRRLDEEGEPALVQMREPVDKFPDYVAYLVRRLKRTCPALGKAKIAQMLARAGLHLGVTTVGRMLKRELSKDDRDVELPVPSKRGPVRAKAPKHIWHVDLSTVPTATGFWVPWLPFARVQRWPFCWWVATAVDHVSRSCIGFAAFERRPTSFQVRSFLGRAIRRVLRGPSSPIDTWSFGSSSALGAGVAGSGLATVRWGSTAASRSWSDSSAR